MHNLVILSITFGVLQNLGHQREEWEATVGRGIHLPSQEKKVKCRFVLINFPFTPSQPHFPSPHHSPISLHLSQPYFPSPITTPFPFTHHNPISLHPITIPFPFTHHPISLHPSQPYFPSLFTTPFPFTITYLFVCVLCLVSDLLVFNI